MKGTCPPMRAYAFDFFVILGVTVMTLGVIGIIRMPDLYTKLHAASKSVFLGVMVLAISGMAVSEGQIITRLILICLTLIFVTPVASHVIGRAGHIVHEQMDSPGAIDESGALIPPDQRQSWHI